VFGFKVKNQRKVSIDAKRRGGKHRTLEAMCNVLAQYSSRRPGGVRQMVRHSVEKALNAMWVLQAAEGSEFGRREGVVHPKQSVNEKNIFKH